MPGPSKQTNLKPQQPDFVTQNQQQVYLPKEVESRNKELLSYTEKFVKNYRVLAQCFRDDEYRNGILKKKLLTPEEMDLLATHLDETANKLEALRASWEKIYTELNKAEPNLENLKQLQNDFNQKASEFEHANQALLLLNASLGTFVDPESGIKQTKNKALSEYHKQQYPQAIKPEPFTPESLSSQAEVIRSVTIGSAQVPTKLELFLRDMHKALAKTESTEQTGAIKRSSITQDALNIASRTNKNTEENLEIADRITPLTSVFTFNRASEVIEQGFAANIRNDEFLAALSHHGHEITATNIKDIMVKPYPNQKLMLEEALGHILKAYQDDKLTAEQALQHVHSLNDIAKENGYNDFPEQARQSMLRTDAERERSGKSKDLTSAMKSYSDTARTAMNNSQHEFITRLQEPITRYALLANRFDNDNYRSLLKKNQVMTETEITLLQESLRDTSKALAKLKDTSEQLFKATEPEEITKLQSQLNTDIAAFGEANTRLGLMFESLKQEPKKTKLKEYEETFRTFTQDENFKDQHVDNIMILVAQVQCLRIPDVLGQIIKHATRLDENSPDAKANLLDTNELTTAHKTATASATQYDDQLLPFIDRVNNSLRTQPDKVMDMVKKGIYTKSPAEQTEAIFEMHGKQITSANIDEIFPPTEDGITAQIKQAKDFISQQQNEGKLTSSEVNKALQELSIVQFNNAGQKITSTNINEILPAQAEVPKAQLNRARELVLSQYDAGNLSAADTMANLQALNKMAKNIGHKDFAKQTMQEVITLEKSRAAEGKPVALLKEKGMKAFASSSAIKKASSEITDLANVGKAFTSDKFDRPAITHGFNQKVAATTASGSTPAANPQAPDQTPSKSSENKRNPRPG